MGLVKQIASETEPLVDLRRKHFYELTVCKYLCSNVFWKMNQLDTKFHLVRMTSFSWI